MPRRHDVEIIAPRSSSRGGPVRQSAPPRTSIKIELTRNPAPPPPPANGTTWRREKRVIRASTPRSMRWLCQQPLCRAISSRLEFSLDFARQLPPRVVEIALCQRGANTGKRHSTSKPVDRTGTALFDVARKPGDVPRRIPPASARTVNAPH